MIWRLAVAVCALVSASVVVAFVLEDWLGDPALAGAITTAALAPVAIWIVRRALVPVAAMFRALAGTVSSYRDGDFAFSLAWKRNLRN